MIDNCNTTTKQVKQMALNNISQQDKTKVMQ